MATSISTTFDAIYLTGNLLEQVNITTDSTSLVVEVFLQDTRIFASVYYPYMNIVCIRDIRSIVEAAMQDRGLVMATLKLMATEPLPDASNITYDEDGNIHIEFDGKDPESVRASVSDIKIIYSAFRTADDSTAFLSKRFLTTRHSALVPRRGGHVLLSNYTRAYAESSNYALILYHDAHSEGHQSYSFNLGRVQSTSETIVTKDLTHDYFKAIVDQNTQASDSTVDGVEYHVGNRQFSIFFTDEEPTDTFTFLNAFNLTETAYLFGATTTKTEVERSEAVCGRKTQFYDETIVVKHEVETSVLSSDEAKWLNQLLTSKLVQRPISDSQSAQVLITDISSEITNSDNDRTRLKFSWKYADGNEWL